MKTFGRTDLYSIGDPKIDELIGGGIGRKAGYSIVLIFGGTGCLSGEMMINTYNSENGSCVKQKLVDLFNNKPDNLYVDSVNPQTRKLTHNKVVDIVYSGQKYCFVALTNRGQYVEATADHKFFTTQGWKELKDIDINDWVFTRDSIGRLELSQIVKKDLLGLRDTYDICCQAPYHSFVANDFVVHNSGKSIIGLNVIASAMAQDKKVGIMILEDDPADAYNRLSFIIDKTIIDRSRHAIISDDQLHESFTLDDVCNHIEQWFLQEDYDIIILDHIQFLFESAVTEKQNEEWNRQRIFMRKLNKIMKKCGKTLIIVSHVNKSSDATGSNKIQGSGSLAQAATKILELRVDSHGYKSLVMHKTRFTKFNNTPIPIRFDSFKLTYDVDTSETQENDDELEL